MTGTPEPASFRDPAGHVFKQDGQYFRQVNEAGRQDFDRLMSSGLYDTLTASRLLVPHDNLGRSAGSAPEAYTVIQPRLVPTISYPYEWCFSQLKDAALATLAIQEYAFAAGMSLKDASAYNVQFLDGRPVLIDTLSLESASPGPWVAYRQFCQHFYGPLALMARVDEHLGRLLQSFIDGIPLRTASRLLPVTTWLRWGPLIHLHLHAVGERVLSGGATESRGVASSTPAQVRRSTPESSAAVVSSLRTAIRHLQWQPRSRWTAYYDDRESYAIEAVEQKTAIVAEWLESAMPNTVWDLGANTGRFSRLATERGIGVVAFDQDAACVERMYLDATRRGDANLLPLVMDLVNPSPSIGWAHEERRSLAQRGPADLALALALVHHLAISNNVPFARIADYLRCLARHLVIEFVPKDDPMVVTMLRSRTDVFADYTESAFEAAFSPFFAVRQRVPLRHSGRILYWMTRR